MRLQEPGPSEAIRADDLLRRPSHGSGSSQLMDRRALLGLFTSALLGAPLAVEAQRAGKVQRIGLLFSSLPSTFPQRWPFYERMRELDWVYGRDYVAEYRVYSGQYARIPDLAAELIRAGVDVFVVPGGADASRIRQVTRTIPIVTWGAGDLVEAGLASSLARPGGNVTGIQNLQPELIPKHLSLLKEAIPGLSRSGVLSYRVPSAKSQPLSPLEEAFRRAAEAGGKALNITLDIVTVYAADELESGFSMLHSRRSQGVIVTGNAFMGFHIKTLAELALKYRLALVSDMDRLAEEGGLISYGYDPREGFRSAADITDKILRGAKAGEIPIQQATTFRLIINLRMAKALGLTIPPSLPIRADEVIQ